MKFRRLSHQFYQSFIWKSTKSNPNRPNASPNHSKRPLVSHCSEHLQPLRQTQPPSLPCLRRGKEKKTWHGLHWIGKMEESIIQSDKKSAKQITLSESQSATEWESLGRSSTKTSPAKETAASTAVSHDWWHFWRFPKPQIHPNHGYHSHLSTLPTRKTIYPPAVLQKAHLTQRHHTLDLSLHEYSIKGCPWLRT